MPLTILVDSQSGNTARLAEAVAQGLGLDVSIIAVGHPGAQEDTLRALESEGLDRLVVAGPTIHRGLSPDLGAMLDTRLRGPGLLLGSAARGAGKRLRVAGAHVVVPPEGFYVRRGATASSRRGRPEDVALVPGELDRARSWGRSLRDALDARKAA